MCDKGEDPNPSAQAEQTRAGGKITDDMIGKTLKETATTSVRQRIRFLEHQQNDLHKTKRLHQLMLENPEVVEMLELMRDLGFIHFQIF